MTEPTEPTEKPAPRRRKQWPTIIMQSRPSTVKTPLGRKERKVAFRHWAFAGREKGVWHPDLVGLVRGYAPTLEAYQKRQENGRRVSALQDRKALSQNRTGIPDGWGGKERHAQLMAVRAKAAAEAKEIVSEMKIQGLIEGEDPRGDEAIEFAVAIIRAKTEAGKPAYSLETQLKAAKLVAEFCKAKPVARTQTKVETAEDFLSVLAAQVVAKK